MGDTQDMTTYTRGLHELGDRCYAYLQPDGGWGWSNAGLVESEGASLLVDTLFDLRLTAEMLEEMGRVTRNSPIATLVNTHANGDHCYGNELVDGVEIVASVACAEEMGDVAPATLAALNADPGELGDLFRGFFGAFAFEGIEVTLPTRTFEGRLDLTVGRRDVQLIEVGPAHTRGDVIVHVPDADTVFTGDILFNGGTPIVWAGPLSNWVAACERILALDPQIVVPGHGPIAEPAALTATADYLRFVEAEATARHAAGLDSWTAAQEIARDMGPDGPGGAFGRWGEFGRLAVNVDTVYRTLDPAHAAPDVVEQFRRMATLAPPH